MNTSSRTRYIATTVVAVVGAPIACLASLAIAAVPLWLAWLALDFARGWS